MQIINKNENDKIFNLKCFMKENLLTPMQRSFIEKCISYIEENGLIRMAIAINPSFSKINMFLIFNDDEICELRNILG